MRLPVGAPASRLARAAACGLAALTLLIEAIEDADPPRAGVALGRGRGEGAGGRARAAADRHPQVVGLLLFRFDQMLTRILRPPRCAADSLSERNHR